MTAVAISWMSRSALATSKVSYKQVVKGQQAGRRAREVGAMAKAGYARR
jgi:hypothetical protein